MNIDIKKIYLNWDGRLLSPTHALLLVPERSNGRLALLCHGYTSHKSSILSWASRLAEEGLPTLIMDIPGHYLGNFSEVESFNDFKLYAHELFAEAFEAACEHLDHAPNSVLLGGHSLGALLSLKALALPAFAGLEKFCIAVGIGMPPEEAVHIFDTPFYKSTLRLREQLVSPELKPDNVFPWIKSEKENLVITREHIHLITGEDDMVVGDNGMERFANYLSECGNIVTSEKPKKLAHHIPENAAPHVKKALKEHGWLN